jgi:hypothetical protein
MMGIKVKALQPGYYGTQRRRVGDVFEIDSEQERGTWMGEPGEPTPPPKKAMPFTSNVQGTRAGGNIYAPAGKKPAWEEPMGESAPVPDKAPEPVKKKSTQKSKSRSRKR